MSSSEKSFLKGLIPPPVWRMPVTIMVGIIVGLGISVIYISNAFSYMSDDPEACINCHIMTSEYSTWFHSSHRERANCNDCHVPHDSFINKYMYKAKDGLRHSYMFTLRLEPQVIKVTEAAKSVIQENCMRCHEYTVNSVSARNVNGENYIHGQGMLCWNCHRETPHGRVHSLSSTPNALVPKLKPVFKENK